LATVTESTLSLTAVSRHTASLSYYAVAVLDEIHQQIEGLGLKLEDNARLADGTCTRINRDIVEGIGRDGLGSHRTKK
jgi:hypothetical protein